MNYTYNMPKSSARGIGLGSTGLLNNFISVLLLIAYIVGLWKVFEKAGKEGWKALIPFYNIYVLLEILGMNGWLCLLLLVPIANIVILIKCDIELAKAFGEPGGFAVGLIFLSSIFMLILGFNSDKYIGVPKK